MSLPPQILRIKRKRTDEPVESLYLENDPSPSKRRVTTSSLGFVFRRLVEPSQDASSASVVTGVPEIITTLPGEENKVLQQLRQGTYHTNTGAVGSKAARRKSSAVPRKFHLSRAASLRSSPLPNISGQLGRKKEVAVFVEQQEEFRSSPHVHSKEISLAGVDTGLGPAVATDVPRKRPRTPATPSSTPARPLPDTSGQQQSKLYEALQRYAAEELHFSNPERIGQHLDGTFSQVHDSDVDMEDVMDTSGAQTAASERDGTDYVYDTYVRYAKTLEALPQAQDADIKAERTEEKDNNENFGYLVIPETEQTLWETFYASDGSSSSEGDWDSEEDDENHENWYGADYPEEEVSSDDDRGENPYRYEENDSDSDGVAYSDDEHD